MQSEVAQMKQTVEDKKRLVETLRAEKDVVVSKINTSDAITMATPEYQALVKQLDAIHMQFYGYPRALHYTHNASENADPSALYRRKEAEEKRIFSLFTKDGKGPYYSRGDKFSGKTETNIRDDVFAVIKSFGPVSKLTGSQLLKMVNRWVNDVLSGSLQLADLKVEMNRLEKERNRLEQEQTNILSNAHEELQAQFRDLMQKIDDAERVWDNAASEAAAAPREAAREALLSKSDEMFATIMAQRKADGEVVGTGEDLN